MDKVGKKKRAEGVRAKPGQTFDAELDALFSTAQPAPTPATTAKPAPKSKVVAPLEEELLEEDGEEKEEEEEDGEEDGEGDLSSLDSDAVISGISDEEEEEEKGVEGDEEDVDDARVEQTDLGQSGAESESEDESEKDDGTRPLHETVADPSLLNVGAAGKTSSAAKRKAAARDEPQSQRDARSLFIGNLPIDLATSKSSMKDLRKHLIACSPYPSATQIESIRLRSIPFSKPTDDYEAKNPDEAMEGKNKRQRSRSYKEALNEDPKTAKTFLSGSQKRKVAFINQEINEKADSVNAYVTLSQLSFIAISQLKEKTEKDISSLNASALAALLAANVNGTLFEDRHLRADLVVPLLPADILETGLSTVRTADGSLLGASAGATSIDVESRKRTVFVGNLDFEAKEEELRSFFETMMTMERGSPPDVNALDFSHSEKLPTPETLGGEKVEEDVKRLPSWVYGVRIIRDAATQMGKGFGYVRFFDTTCVDEIMAIHESEQNILSALKAGKEIGGPFRRKLKFKSRPLRVSRCKVSKGNVTTSTNSNGATMTPKRPTLNIPQRSRSSGAPTPGGSSPHFRQQQQQRDTFIDSPTRKSKSSAHTTPNPANISSDPMKAARNAQKRQDPQRQAKRLEKKNKKRAEYVRLANGGDKSKIKVKVGKGGGFNKKAGRLGSLAVLSMVALIMGLVMPASANNEIVNFGPTLCRADEVGHLEDKAARQVSRGWPVLYPSSQPTLFSINPTIQPEGVWLILALDPEEAFLEMKAVHDVDDLTTPQSLATKAFPLLTKGHNDHLTPRDRWMKGVWNKFNWAFNNRFTFRVTWAPNFFLDVKAEVYSARSMLAKGKITWKANEEDMESLQQEQELIGQDISRWPCPRLYVHVQSREEKVQIPSKVEWESGEEVSFPWKAFAAIAEAYIGPLVGKPDDDPEATALTPIPVHLVLEPVYLGFIPQTALSLLTLLIPFLAFTAVWILPPISKAFRTIASAEERIKTD